MKMRPSTSAGGSDKSNNLTFTDLCAVADPFSKAAEMSIAGCVSCIMLDFDQFAVGAIPTRLSDDAVPDCPDRGSLLRREIYSRMRQTCFQYWMKTGFREPGRDAGKLQREP